MKRGFYASGRRKLQCLDCRHYIPIHESPFAYQSEEEGAKFSGSHGVVSVTSRERPKTEADMLRICEVDTDVWEVDHWLVNRWEMGRKDRQVDLTWNDGLANGSVNDTGQIVVEPLWQIKVWLRRKQEKFGDKEALEELKRSMIEFAPKYPKLSWHKYQGGMLFEVDLPDLHFGRLTWNEESGEDYDIHIARQTVESVVAKLLGHTQGHKISKILIPLGNDYFNVNGKGETTIHGTPQQEDTRWAKTYKRGRELAIWIIDQFAQVAPVDVIIVAGNHDEERTFYLGDALECWYNRCNRVSIDNGPKKRKYYKFSQNLLGFTHGYYERISRLPALMPIECASYWADTRFREWHLGDKHHKTDLVFKTEEDNGVVIRILRALTTNDVWTDDKGYVGALRAAEGFLWHPQEGLIAQFPVIPNT